MMTYAPVRADQILKEGDTVTLGDVTLTAHLTPGHTKGCTSWTLSTTEDGKSYDVLFFGSLSIVEARSW